MTKLMFVHYSDLQTIYSRGLTISQRSPHFFLCPEWFHMLCLCCTWAPVTFVRSMFLSLVIGRSPHDTRPPATAICLRGFHDITHNSRWWRQLPRQYWNYVTQLTWATNCGHLCGWWWFRQNRKIDRWFKLLQVRLSLDWDLFFVPCHHEIWFWGASITIRVESWASAQ